MEEFGFFAFKGVSDELEYPPEYEQRQRNFPETIHERDDRQHEDADCDHRNADGVAEAVDRMLMAGRVLRDPLLPGAIA